MSSDKLIGELNGSIEKLKQENSAEITKHNQKIKELEDKIVELKSQSRISTETIKEFKHEKEAYVTKINELEAKIALLIKEKGDARSLHESSRSDLEKIIADLKTKLNESNIENHASRETISRITLERDSIESSLNRSRAEAEAFKKVFI